MATIVLKDAHFAYSTGTTSASTGAQSDLSAFVRSIAIAEECETQDETAMGDNSRYALGGLKSWAISVEMNQDFATTAGYPGALDSIIGSTIPWWQVRADAATTVCSTNPEYRGYGMLTSIGPISGSVGDLATVAIEIVGIGDLTRGTTTTTG